MNKIADFKKGDEEDEINSYSKFKLEIAVLSRQISNIKEHAFILRNIELGFTK